MTKHILTDFSFILFCKGSLDKLLLRCNFHSISLNFALNLVVFKQIRYKYEIVMETLVKVCTWIEIPVFNIFHCHVNALVS